MSSVDNRIVNMVFNNKGFEAGVASTLSSLKKLNESLKMKNTGKGLDEVSKGINNLSKTGLGSLGSAVEGIGSKFSAMGVVAASALATITNKAVNAGMSLMKSLTIDPLKTGLSEYETKMNSMQTIFANTSHKGTTYDDIVKALDELNAYSDKTIYNFAQMTDNIGKFTSAGVDLDRSVASIKGLANVAAMSGVDNARAAGVMYQASQAMSKGYFQLMDWRSFSNNGMGNERFRDALIQTSEVLGTGAKAAIEAAGSFDESLSKSKWLTSDVMAETLSILAGSYDKATLISKGYSESQADSLLSLAKDAENAATQIRTVTQLFDTMGENIQSGWAKSWEWIIGDKEQATELLTNISKGFESIINPMADARNKVLEQWNKGGGRDSAIQGFSNIFSGIGKVAGSVKDAFRDIFPAMTGKRLIELTKGFEKFTENLKVSDKTAAKIKDTFKGVFSIFDIGKKAVTSLFKAFAPSAGGLFGGLTNGLLTVTSTLGRFFTSINEGIDASGIFEKISSSISSGLKGIGDGFLKVGDFIGNLFKSMGKIDFKPLMNFAGQIGTNFGSGIGDFFSGIGEAVSNIDLNKILGVITSLSGLKLFKSLRGMFDGFGDSLGTFSKIGKSVGELLDSVTGPLKAMSFDINANALLKIAGAVGILALALSGLSSIDATGMATAITGIMTLMAGLAATMIALNKFSGGGGKGGFLGNILGSLFGGGSATSGATGLIMLATSLLILSGALKMISSLNPEQMITGLAGVAGSMLVLVGAAKLLDGIKGKLIKAGTSMILMATALNIVASAVEKFSQINPNNMLVGLMGIAAALAELAIFMKFADFGGIGITNAAGIAILASSLLILQNAVTKFGSMDVGSLVQGLAGVATALAVIAGFSHISGSAAHLLGIAAALIVMGGALHILSSAVRSMAGMQWDDMARGLTAMAGSLLILAAAVKLMSGIGLLAVGAGLIVASAGLLVMAAALKSLGEMSWDEMGRGLVALAGGLLVLGIAAAAMSGMVVGAGAILILAAAMAVLTPQLIAMSNLSWGQIGAGLTMLGGSLLILSIAGAAATALGPGLLMLGGAIALLGVGCLAAGAGIAMLATGLATLAAVGTAGGAALAAVFTELINLLPQLGVKLGEFFVNLATSIASGIPQILNAMGQMLEGILQSFATYAPRIIEVGTQLVVMLATALANAAPKLASAAVTLITALLTAITESASSLASAGADMIIALCEGLGNEVGRIIDAGLKLAEDFLNGLAEGIEAHSSSLGTAIGNVFTAAMEGAGILIKTALKGVGKDAVTGFADGIEDGGSDVKSSVKSVIKDGESEAKNSKEKFNSAGKAMIKGLADGIKAGSTDVKTAIDKIVNDAVNKAKSSSSKFNSAGKDWTSKLSSGIRSGSSGASSAVKSCISSAISAARGATSQFFSAGSSMIQGLVSGIKSAASSVASAARSVVQGAINAAKSALKINSPSKVFIAIGKSTNEGFVKGINADANESANAAENLAYAVIDSMKSTISKVGDAVNMDLNANPTIRPVMDLSNVANGARLIDGMLSNTSLNANLSASMSRSMGQIQNGNSNDELISEIKKLQGKMTETGNVYNINGITYDDGSNVHSAIETLIRATTIERRM